MMKIPINIIINMISINETHRDTSDIEISLSTQEQNALREEAAADGQTVDQFLRSAAMDYLKSQTPEQKRVKTPVLQLF